MFILFQVTKMLMIFILNIRLLTKLKEIIEHNDFF